MVENCPLLLSDLFIRTIPKFNAESGSSSLSYLTCVSATCSGSRFIQPNPGIASSTMLQDLRFALIKYIKDNY